MTENFSKFLAPYANVITLRNEELKKILSDKITMNLVSISGKQGR